MYIQTDNNTANLVELLLQELAKLRHEVGTLSNPIEMAQLFNEERAAKMLDIADRPRSVFGVLSVHAVVCESLPQDAFGNVGLAGLIGKTGVELGAIRRVIKKIKTLPQQNKVNALGSGTGEEENWILSSIAVVSQGAVKSN